MANKFDSKSLFDLILKKLPFLKAPTGFIAGKYEEVSLLNTILGLSITLLFIVVFFVIQRFAETNQNFQDVSRVNQVILQTSDLETLYPMMGAKVRTVLTSNFDKESIYDSLETYHRESTEAISKIHSSWSQDRDSRYIVDSIQLLINKRFALWDNVARTDVPFNDSSHMIELNKVSAQFFRLTMGLKKEEYAQLNYYMASSKNGIKVASEMVIVITLFSVSLILFAFLRINREVKRVKDVGTLLENKIKELDRSNQQLEQFAYVASHDLHDPLRKLNVFSEHLEQKESERLSSEGKVLIKRIQRLVGQMQELIDAFLDLSLNYQSQDKKSVNLNKILDHARQNLSLKIQSSNAVIHSSSLPVITGYESQLKQLFQNLLSNSIRYAQKDVPPRVDIKYSTVTGANIQDVKSSDKQKKFHKLSFSDNGIGFDNKYAEKIFIIFQRLHGKSEYPGSGIGLATCKLIIENHEGYITASGKVNEGAEFVVYLPA